MSEKIKYCINCNSPLPSSARFCFECGHSEFADTPKLKDRYCKHCFIKLDEDEEVCPICEGEDFVNSIEELCVLKNKNAIAKENAAKGKLEIKLDELKNKLSQVQIKIDDQKQVMYKHPSIEDMRKHLADEQTKANKLVADAKNKFDKHQEALKKAESLANISKGYEGEYNKLKDELLDLDQEITNMENEIYSLENSLNESTKLIEEYEKRINKVANKRPEFFDVYIKKIYSGVGRYLYEWEKYFEAEYFLLKAHKLGSREASAFLLFMYLDEDNPLYNEKEAEKIADVSIEYFKKNKQSMFYESVYRLCCSIKNSKHYSAWAVNEVVNNFVFTFHTWTQVDINYILLKRMKCYPEMYLILLNAFNRTISYNAKIETLIKSRITHMINKLKNVMSKEEEKMGMELYTARDFLTPDYYSLSDARMGYSKTLNAYRMLMNNGYLKVLGKYAYLNRITYTLPKLDDRTREILLKVDYHKSPTATAELGWYYLEHFTVRSQNPKMAVEYFTKAYNDECLEGAVGLGMCYLKGHGVDKDEAKGLEYLKLAAEHSCHRAYTELGKYYFNLGKYDEALPYLELAYSYKEAVHYELAYTRHVKGASANNILPLITKRGNLEKYSEIAYSLDLLHFIGGIAERLYNHSHAVMLMEKAAENGHINSMKWMIKECEKQKDIVKLEKYKKLLKEVVVQNG